MLKSPRIIGIPGNKTCLSRTSVNSLMNVLNGTLFFCEEGGLYRTMIRTCLLLKIMFNSVSSNEETASAWLSSGVATDAVSPDLYNTPTPPPLLSFLGGVDKFEPSGRNLSRGVVVFWFEPGFS